MNLTIDLISWINMLRPIKRSLSLKRCSRCAAMNLNPTEIWVSCIPKLKNIKGICKPKIEIVCLSKYVTKGLWSF